jgi:RNA polymerase sigma-70 factor (ECF subfamily)
LTQIITYTEEELVEKLKLKNEQAFGFLYDHYSKALYSVIYQMIPHQEIAEDLLQQVFLKIWKNIQLYDASKGRLFTWMLNIPVRGNFRTKEKLFLSPKAYIITNKGATGQSAIAV